jgi:YNFM family putative membrane transporter
MHTSAQTNELDVPSNSDGKTVASIELLIIAVTAFLTVVDLFATQALLPTLAQHYHVSAAAMGLAVNACTLGMAIGGLSIALLSDRIERRTGIFASLVALSVPTFLLAFAPTIGTFAILRISQGLFMASAFGLTLAYLGEHFTADQSAAAFAAYITGNVASNLIGRLVATAVTDHAGLTANFIVFAGLNLLGAALVYGTIRQMPVRRAACASDAACCQPWWTHVQAAEMRAGFAIGFCILFAFIGTFTYVNFVLVAPPLGVGMMTLGFIYIVFLPSIATTPLAGRIAKRLGHQISLWTALLIAAAGLPLLIVPSLPAIIIGMVLVAVGTFLAQALTTGFVSRAAKHNRASASGIYLASYFSGGLIGTAVLGQIFDGLGWTACVVGIAASLAAAAWLTRYLNATS